MHHQNPYAASDRKSLAMPESGRAPGPSSLYPLVMKTAPGGKQRLRFSNTCMKRRNWGTVPVDDTHAPPMTAHPRKRKRESNEPLTAGGRELRLTARPPARFSSLRTPRLVNQKQESSGNTLLAQRYPLPGNRYLWRTTYRWITIWVIYHNKVPTPRRPCSAMPIHPIARSADRVSSHPDRSRLCAGPGRALRDRAP